MFIKVGYNITNLGTEKAWMELAARGQNFNIHLLTPENARVRIIPLVDSYIIEGPVNPGTSFSGFITIENNEKQMWSTGEGGEPYVFPAGTYSMYAEYKNGEAYSPLIFFEIP